MNKGASIRAKLSSIAKAEGVAFQTLIFRFLHERFLYRLSQSHFKNNFFLKGGVLLYAIENEITRPTKDVDFLGSGVSNDLEEIKNAFIEICKVNDDDSVWFNIETITSETIKEDDKYEGVRLFIEAGFDTIKQKIQVDVGFGDIIVPQPQVIEYPLLLSDEKSVFINAYSKESIISEKFHAMIELSFFNSRMKDFYDVYFLLQSKEIDKIILTESIQSTFKNRETIFTNKHSFFNTEFSEDLRLTNSWKLFLKKNKLNEVLQFNDVVNFIVKEIKPIWKHLINLNQK